MKHIQYIMFFMIVISISIPLCDAFELGAGESVTFCNTTITCEEQECTFNETELCSGYIFEDILDELDFLKSNLTVICNSSEWIDYYSEKYNLTETMDYANLTKELAKCEKEKSECISNLFNDREGLKSYMEDLTGCNNELNAMKKYTKYANMTKEQIQITECNDLISKNNDLISKNSELESLLTQRAFIGFIAGIVATYIYYNKALPREVSAHTNPPRTGRHPSGRKKKDEDE